MNHPVALNPAVREQASPISDNAIAKPTVKVLHLINGEHFSGAERVQDLLALRLDEFGYTAGFACLKEGRFPQERKSQNTQLFELEMRRKVDIKAIRKLRRLILDNGYKMLHAHTPRSLLVGSMLSLRMRMPLVYHVHSPVGLDSTRSFSNRVNQFAESMASKRVDHFVCVSDSIRSYMRELGHPTERMTTVPNGVAIIDDVRPKTTPTGTWTLGTTALFRPRKGTEVLLEALSILRKQGFDIRLLAVGPFETEEYETKIKSLAEELSVSDIINWTGFTSDVNSLFQQMDAFVLPSLFGEGMPMVVLEAMAGGIPVVAAEVEGITQAIRDNKDGLIFRPGDAAHLATRLSDLMSGKHDWLAIRESALERQRKKFSDRNMAKKVAEVYERVLDSKRK